MDMQITHRSNSSRKGRMQFHYTMDSASFSKVLWEGGGGQMEFIILIKYCSSNVSLFRVRSDV